MSTRLVSAAAFTVILGAAGAAAAQPVAERAEHPRVGFLGGLGLHAGNISCEGDNCDGFREAGGIDLHAGWGFGPRVAGVADLWVMGSKEDNLSITHAIVTVNVRYWALDILWVQGGLGAASASYRYDAGIIQVEDRTENVPAVAFAAGLELLRSPRFALDVQARVGFGFYDDDDDGDGTNDATGRSASLGVGFTWY